MCPGQRGAVLLVVLVFSALVALMAAAALLSGALDTRIAAGRSTAVRARNLADTALELLVRRVEARWPAGGVHCAADRYCDGDFPGVAALRSSLPADLGLQVSLEPLAAPVPLRLEVAAASAAARVRQRYLEARVSVTGAAAVDLAVGLALPLAAGAP